MVLLGLLGLVVLLPGVLLLPLEPMPLELGDGVLLPLELGDVVLLPLVAPPLLLPLVEELDLKCASHSEREICPSLLVSTDEKLGAELLDAPLLDMPLEPPLAELPPLDAPPLDMPDDPDELPEGVALCEDLSELLPEAPEDDEPELCAMDTLAIAKSAAAVAVPTSFNMWMFLLHKD